MHMLRIIIKGVFDRFPKLQFVLGHCGQALPFWVFRINYMHRAGMASEPPIMLCHQVMGADRVMYAMDYPYQFVPEVVAISDALLMTALDKRKYFQLNAERVVNFSA